MTQQTFNYKLGDLNVDILPNQSEPLPADLLKAVTFEFPGIVRFGLIHSYSYGETTTYNGSWDLYVALYSSPLTNRAAEDQVGSLHLSIDNNGRTKNCQVKVGPNVM